MLKLILNRLLMGLVVIFCLMAITFTLIRLMPGDPFTSEKSASEQVNQRNREIFALDKPIPEQFLMYLKQLPTGEMGYSPKRNQPVTRIIKHALPASLILGFSSIFIAIGIGIPAGIISALKKNSMIDYGTMIIAMLGISIPTFVMGPVLADQIASRVPFLKVAGWGGPMDWALPSITLGLATAAYIARITRGGMLDILNQDYIRTARAKGLKERVVVIKHALKGGLIPAIAYIGPAFAMLLTGSFVVETIFQVPGMGQHFVNATTDRDYFLLQGVVLLLGGLIVLVNLLSDIALIYLNPRLQQEH